MSLGGSCRHTLSEFVFPPGGHGEILFATLEVVCDPLYSSDHVSPKGQGD